MRSLNKKNLILITARSGSKGVKNKNLKKINNLTLIEYKYRCALKAKIPNSEIVVSTDSKKYITYLSSKDIKSIDRPKYLAQDNTESLPVLVHAIREYEKKKIFFENLILLEPATPFTLPISLKKAYNIFINKNLGVIASIEETNIHSHFVSEINNTSLNKMLTKMSNIKKYRRQLFKPQFKMDGGFYIFKTKNLNRKLNLFHSSFRSEGYIVDKIQAHNIENKLDLQIARSYLNFFQNRFKIFEN